MKRQSARPPSSRADRSSFHGGMSLRRYARISAQLRFFPRTDKAAVLAANLLTEPAWEASRKAWSVALKESVSGDGRLLSQWTNVFEKEWGSIQSARPQLKSLIAENIDDDSDLTETNIRVGVPAAKRFGDALDVDGSEEPTLVAKAKTAARGSSPPPSAKPQSRKLPFGAITESLDSRPNPSIRNPSLAETAGSLAITRPRAKTGKPRSHAPGPMLTLEQYAAVCAETAAFPERGRAAWTKVGITHADAHGAIESHWNEERQKDPALDRHFLTLYRQYFQHWRTR